MASGVLAQPHVIEQILRDSGEVAVDNKHEWPRVHVDDDALTLIQEGLRGVVRMPTGTAHALDSQGFPIAVMGKTGTTNNFRDALFVGSTYGPEGVTVAVRIGFDDNRSLGPRETGGRVALPVFKEIMLDLYRKKLAGPVPEFPPEMEQRISIYLNSGPVETAAVADASLAGMFKSRGLHVRATNTRQPAPPWKPELLPDSVPYGTGRYSTGVYTGYPPHLRHFSDTKSLSLSNCGHTPELPARRFLLRSQIG
jgi:membrane carboxypeptidase/penicillin-binding protein